MKTVLDYSKFEKLVQEKSSLYQCSEPFPHIVIENFLDPEIVLKASQEVDQIKEHASYYRHYNSKKYACNDLSKMGPATQAIINELQSKKFINLVSQLSGIKGLIQDPTLEGGGVHILNQGGFLNVHTDFLSHAKFRNWSRKINILIYLNPDWKDEYQGQLELWDKTGKRLEKAVSPLLNRCVIFSTIPKSYHGNPRPVNEPTGKSRKSIALYYYCEEIQDLKIKTTDYISLPEVGMLGRIANSLDKIALLGIALSKRYLGLTNEGFANNIKKILQWYK